MRQFDTVEILIVEDNPNDAELTIRALGEQKLANRIYIVEDGAQARDFIFCRRKFAERKPGNEQCWTVLAFDKSAPEREFLRSV
ncbi:MAG: hypothetical protein AB1552_11350 [Nitrospirota bacterium]